MQTLHALLIAGFLASCLPLQAADADPAMRPFGVGEKLQYRIFWGPLPVGLATLEVTAIDQVDGHACYRVEGKARTVGLGRMMYRFESHTTSWIDARGLFTRRFEQDGREGRRVKRFITTFDYTNNRATTQNLVTGDKHALPLTAPVQDFVSAFYYIRAQPLAVDREQTFLVNSGKEHVDVTIRPDARRELSLRPTGDREALRIEPEPTLPFVAKNQGRMWFWVSDDQDRLPLLMRSTMSIGSARMVLYDMVPAPGGGAPTPRPVLSAATRQ